MIVYKIDLVIFLLIKILKNSKKLYNKLIPNIEILRLFISSINKYILHFNMKIYNDIYPFIGMIQIIINNPQKDYTSLNGSYNKA